MKKHFVLSLALVSFAVRAGKFELATIMGQPDMSLPFTQALVRKQVNLVNGPFETDSTTKLYSLLAREGVLSTVSYGITSTQGVAAADAYRAFEEASQEADVLVTHLGPFDDERSCRLMADHFSNVFVLGAGSSAYNSADLPESCVSSNIVRVAALNARLTDLAPFSNYGVPFVKIAAPGMNIQVTGPGGEESTWSGTTYAASFVAARLVVFARLHPELKGGDLAATFLGSTPAIPALAGKTVGAHAIW